MQVNNTEYYMKYNRDESSQMCKMLPSDVWLSLYIVKASQHNGH